MNHTKILRISIFPLLFLGLLLLIVSDNTQLLLGSKKSVVYTYTFNLLKGEIGTGYGAGQAQGLSGQDLLPGDIILGGYPNCAYGKYSHAGLYIGNNEVLEGYVDYGLSKQELAHYMDYSQLCVLRVEADPKIKQQAVAYAMRFEGSCFYPVAFKAGDRYWNCSKIIWKAYLQQGINLDPNNDLWIAPESFCYGPHVIKVFEKGN